MLILLRLDQVNILITLISHASTYLSTSLFLDKVFLIANSNI